VAVEVRVQALLFQHEHALAQGQHLVQVVGTEFVERVPLPGDHAYSGKIRKRAPF